MDLMDEESRLGNWPRRLLHVPTMTSYPWQEGNVYGGAVKPLYNAISYTWGRWRLVEDSPGLDHVKAIAIEGTEWDIPRIHPDHFTSEQFCRAVEAATRSPFRFQDLPSDMLAPVEFLWLDVACIDQRATEPRSAAEVGRQAMIFDGARHVFVWLSSRDAESFQLLIASTAVFEGTGGSIDEPEWDDSDNDENKIEIAAAPANAPIWTQLQNILEDPWWSSLWTLQEAYMRADAYLLSDDGQLVTFPRSMKPYYPWRLSELLVTYENLAKVCEKAITDDSTSSWHEGMRDMFKQKGLRALSTRNPIATYEAATKRQTSYEVDRVYGIQQIFDCRIGNTKAEAASKAAQFSLDDLEEQLGLELLDHLPVSSQFHVFTKPVTLALQWRIQQYSLVPGESATYTCYMDEVSPNMEYKCRFTVRSKKVGEGSIIEVAGLTMHLERMVHATKQLNSERPIGSTVTLLKVFLDTSPSIVSPVTAHYTGCDDEGTIQWLLSSYGPEAVSVVCLGIAFGFYSCRIYGVVVVEQHPGWQRLGLCFWEIFDDPSRQTISSVPQLDVLLLRSVGCSWKPFRGLYGTTLA
jgi:hypothetical protein